MAWFKKEESSSYCCSFHPSASVILFFLLELWRESHSCCPCRVSSSFTERFGHFWSWVWCEKTSRDWQKGSPCVLFQHHPPCPSKEFRISTSVPGNEHPGLGKKIFCVLQCWKSLANPGFTLSWKYRDTFLWKMRWNLNRGWFSSRRDYDLFMTIYCSGFLHPCLILRIFFGKIIGIYESHA